MTSIGVLTLVDRNKLFAQRKNNPSETINDPQKISKEFNNFFFVNLGPNTDKTIPESKEILYHGPMV